MEEIKLIEQAVNGDKDSFCALYGLYKDRLYRFAFYKLGNAAAAEDAVSDCVLSAWKGIRGLRSAEAFSAWIFRILGSCCSRQIRELMSEREKLEQLVQNTAGNLPDRSAAVELSEALDILEEEDRDMVLLSVIAGLSGNEIGEMYGMPSGTVRSRLSRSLAKMRAFLKAE